MELILKEFEVTKEISEQISRRLLFVLNQKGYTVNQFIEKKDLDGTWLRCLLSGVKLYEAEDLQTLADVLEMSKDFFLLEADESDELKMILYSRYYHLKDKNRAEMSGMMDDIFSILF